MHSPFTVIVSLDELDASTATLIHRDPSGGPSLARLTLLREHWVDLGRPSTLKVEMTEP